MGSVTIQDADIGALVSGDYPLIPLTIPAIFEMSASCCLKSPTTTLSSSFLYPLMQQHTISLR
jgi:hypothetical protein